MLTLLATMIVVVATAEGIIVSADSRGMLLSSKMLAKPGWAPDAEKIVVVGGHTAVASAGRGALMIRDTTNGSILFDYDFKRFVAGATSNGKDLTPTETKDALVKQAHVLFDPMPLLLPECGTVVINYMIVGVEAEHPVSWNVSVEVSSSQRPVPIRQKLDFPNGNHLAISTLGTETPWPQIQVEVMRRLPTIPRDRYPDLAQLGDVAGMAIMIESETNTSVGPPIRQVKFLVGKRRPVSSVWKPKR